MKHSFKQKIFYSDTDAYCVVWHGAYLRWLEMGRVLWCEQNGYSLVDLQKQDIVLPVVEIDIKYKYPAKLNDNIIIETSLDKFNSLSFTFKQIIKSCDNKIFTHATVSVVAVHNDGKLYRKLPDFMLKLFERELYEVK